MSWNGSGTFNRKHNWTQEAAVGTPILAANFDDDTNDITSNGLGNCITRDGQGGPTANIGWNSFKITSLANGVAVGDAVNYGQVFNSGTFTTPTLNGATGTGTINFTAATFTVATQATGNNTTLAASTAFVTQTAMNAALPNQGGHADNFVTTDNTNASWSNTLKATVIRFKDGADATKQLAFSLTGITTGNTRTVTIPDKSGTMAMVSDVPTVFGLTLLTTLTPTAQNTLDALTAFSGTYDNYRVVFSGLKCSAADILQIRLANGGTADAGSNYINIGWGGANFTSTSTQINVTGTDLTTDACDGWFDIFNVNDATANMKSALISTVYHSSGGYGNNAVGFAYTASNAVSGFRLFWSTGTTNFAASGKVRIYGYQNA